MMEMDNARSKKIKKDRQTSLTLQGPYGWFFHFMDQACWATQPHQPDLCFYTILVFLLLIFTKIKF
jgi:hypothetical protein